VQVVGLVRVGRVLLLRRVVISVAVVGAAERRSRVLALMGGGVVGRRVLVIVVVPARPVAAGLVERYVVLVGAVLGRRGHPSGAVVGLCAAATAAASDQAVGRIVG